MDILMATESGMPSLKSWKDLQIYFTSWTYHLDVSLDLTNLFLSPAFAYYLWTILLWTSAQFS